jgi:hypothetical protein
MCSISDKWTGGCFLHFSLQFSSRISFKLDSVLLPYFLYYTSPFLSFYLKALRMSGEENVLVQKVTNNNNKKEKSYKEMEQKTQQAFECETCVCVVVVPFQ